MSCYYPMQALRLFNAFTKTGANVVRVLPRFHNIKASSSDFDLINGLPCGQCVGCRLERSRQWAIRMVHEAQLHADNCFITLTFDDHGLNSVDREVDNPMSLNKREFQLFMKRLRKSFYPKKFRYYMCGEYGELFKRPHYHAILFGVDFDDKKLIKIKDGFRYYSSERLRESWSFGNNLITDVSFDSCAYVARYIMKKHLGKNAWKHYFDYMDENSGELFGHRLPEYTTMSRRSGIGKEWLDKYLQDIYPKDKVFMRDKGCYSKPPKYYDSLYEIIDPLDFLRIKEARVQQALLSASDNTPERLMVKEVVKLAQLNSLKRNLE